MTVNDDVAVPKVIDFGIAKATGQALTDKTLVTRFHGLTGTPAYMSPEQAEFSSVDIDTRSDVYSLERSPEGMLYLRRAAGSECGARI